MISATQVTYPPGPANLVTSSAGKYFLTAGLGSVFFLGGNAAVSPTSGFPFPAGTSLEMTLTDSDDLFISGAGTLYILKIS